MLQKLLAGQTEHLRMSIFRMSFDNGSFEETALANCDLDFDTVD